MANKTKPNIETLKAELSAEIMMYINSHEVNGKVRDPEIRRTIRRLQAAFDVLTDLDSALFNYHYALDHRENGDVAADRLVKKIQEILGKPWVQGATMKGHLK